MERVYKVVDQPNLQKVGGVVMNTDQEAYNAYIARRKEREGMEKMRSEVDELKEQLAQAMKLIKELSKWSIVIEPGKTYSKTFFLA